MKVRHFLNFLHVCSVLDNIYFSRFSRPLNLGLQAQDSESLFIGFYPLVCGTEIVAPENGIKQVVHPKVRVGVRVPGHPFMGVHSCYPSLFRRYLLQVVLNMKLSVLNSMSGFHLEVAPPIVSPFPSVLSHRVL